jgi:SpoIID/LytB domain protein
MKQSRLAALALVLLLAGCVPPRPGPEPQPVMTGTPVAATAAPALPALDHEPELAVQLADGQRLSCHLLVPATHPQLGTLSGIIEATADGGVLRINGVPVAGESVAFDMPATSVRFTARPIVDGVVKPELRFAGRPVFRLGRGRVELGELVPMETYLAGVVGNEMAPSWPAAALAAQAIAARSYAADRWLRRFAKPWQLHWHFTRDMAYGGVPAKPQPAVLAAINATRGQILMHDGLPLPALFHAASGGRTAGITALEPGMRMADGATDAAAFLPGVPDPASQRGATALRMEATHNAWAARIPLDKLSAAIAAVRGGQLYAGRVTGVDLVIDPIDERARSLQVTIDGAQGERTITVPAAALRLAVGPGVLRSTWITRTAVAKGEWQVRGRGFGHGVGLSQVGAWQLAKDGRDAASIVATYYPDAVLEHRW